MSNATFGVNVETSTPIYVTCSKCGYAWDRVFIPNKRIACSKCKTSIVMPSVEGYSKLKKDFPKDYPHGKAEVMYAIPYSVLMDRRFRRALSWAEANGEDMMFHSDDEHRLLL